MSSVETLKMKETSSDFSTTVSFGDNHTLHLEWNHKDGVKVSPLHEGKLDLKEILLYSNFLEHKVLNKMQEFDLANQENFLDLSSLGLEKRTDLTPSPELDYKEIWVKPNTAKLEFGTLFITWKTLRYGTSRAHGSWQIQINGLSDCFDHTLNAPWYAESKAEELAKKVIADEGTLILELSLTQTEKIQAFSGAWDRAHIAKDFAEEMGNNQHTPYTSVAKKLKEGFSITSRGRYNKTIVVPLTLPNKKSPAILVRYHNPAAAEIGRKILAETLQEVVDLPPYGRGLDDKVQVWAKDASIFTERNGGNRMRDWLTHNAALEARSYNHKRKANV
jgi:hypothetical protein